MALYHHDSRDYATAAKEAGAKAREKLAKLIDGGTASATAVIEKVQTEIPQDRIVRGSAVRFEPTEKGIAVVVPDAPPAAKAAKSDFAALLDKPLGGAREKITRNAMGQLCTRAGLNVGFAHDTIAKGDWGRELIAHNLTELYKHNAERFLLRSYNGEARGWLSDSFRRLDSRPLLDAFIAACIKIGARPIDGHATDTKVALKAVLPIIFEPLPNEVMVFGLQWENSDYGNGANAVRSFCTRLWCTNTATAEDTMRQVHLGKRLSDDLRYSERTYRLDTEAAASALGDVVSHTLNEDRINEYMDAIRKADADKIDPKQALAMLRKGLGKGDAERVIDAFKSADVEMMPAGNTRYRLSNAVSWIAGQTEDAERKLDLQRFAGQLLA